MSEVIELHSKNTRKTKLNVLGQPLDECSCDPMTGWFRDGTCSTDEKDQGHHVICCELTDEFLKFSKDSGNDLSTPRPEFGFEGLKAGNHWCLCSTRWKEALDAGKAPAVILKSTHLSSLEVVSLEQLKKHALDLN